MRVSYHATLLNVSAGLYLAATSLYGLMHINKASATETVQMAEMPGVDTAGRWGMLALAGLLAVGGLALLADLLIQRSVLNRNRQNRIGLCIVLLIAIGLLTLR